MPRASVTLLGAVLLLGVTLLLVIVLTAAVTGFAPTEHGEPVVIEVSADADTDRVVLEHVSGPPLDVRVLTVRVEVNGEPLTHQPPVPFFSATGFRSGPTGPFNPSADPTWEVGEEASFRVAATTNAPSLAAGAELSVIVSRNDLVVARLTTTIG